MSDLESFIPLIKFIARFLGSDSEVVLYDAKKEAVVFIENPFNPQVDVGSPIPDMEKRFIKKQLYKEEDSIVNYRAFSSERKKLRSATHFIKNPNGELLGVLTINYKVDELIELRNLLNRLISGSEPIQYREENFYEGFNLSFEDLLTTTIQDALKKFDVPPERLSHDEKMELIRLLDEKGTFLLKGSIAELARILQTSETSVYRYISKL
ncbi:helix-turn-helix transcriptional regulator [Neobacillus notoginsengisoli]|uniref:helix-turn-helix transcriptional regulator n=1 Tax=Neobacillus notoginsengisoli TaxID=1578198 RepID=UPI001314D12B|nr:PAS domain-containing protein [Neobacillus notoginsengisoli]